MDVLTAIKTRRSVRGYVPRPIPEEVLDRMREALRWAPSACNFQPWHFIFITDGLLRRQVAKAANDQMWMAEAPVTVVGCGIPEQAYQHMRGAGNSVEIDVAIALDHLALAAVAEGLGTCWIGAFDEAQVKQLLNVPAPVMVVALMPLGYPLSSAHGAPQDDTSRKPMAKVFSTDVYEQR